MNIIVFHRTLQWSHHNLNCAVKQVCGYDIPNFERVLNMTGCAHKIFR
jgi:hypothetical protein